MADRTPRLDRRRFLAGLALATGALPAGAAEPGGGARPRVRGAVNLGTNDYWTATRNFLNVLWDTAGAWQDDETGTPSPHLEDWGWPAAIPPGRALRKLVWLHLDPQHGHAEPGEYVFRSTCGLQLDLAFHSPNVVDVRPGRNLCRFTIRDRDLASTVVCVRVRNPAGSPLSPPPGDITLHRAAYQGLVDAGEVFHPALLANLRGTFVIRSLDLCAVNDTPWQDPRDIVPLARFHGGYRQPGTQEFSNAWPPELFAQLCRRVGAGMWWCAPAALTPASRRLSYRCDARTGRFRLEGSRPFGEGDVLFHLDSPAARFNPAVHTGPYFVVGATDEDFQLSLTRGGPPVAVTRTIDGRGPEDWRACLEPERDAYALMYAAAQRLHDAWPDCPEIHTEFANENWNGGFRSRQMVEVIGAFRATGRPGTRDAGRGAAWYQLQAWKATEAFFPRSVCRRAFGAQMAWFGNVGSGLDLVDPGFLAAGRPVHALLDEYAVAPYVQPAQNLEGDSYDWPQLVAERAAAWRPDRWAQSVDNALRALDRQFAAARAELDRRRPGIPFTTYEMGQHWFHRPPEPNGPGSDASALHAAWLSYWFGPAGAPSREAYRRLLERWGVDLATHYTASGGWASGGLQMSWGRSRHFFDSTDLLTWHRTGFATKPP